MAYLVIAEKPSVAQAIAKVLGCNTRKDGYLEGGSYLVSWCVGHLVELAEPEQYDGKYELWKKEDLPILPKDFKYQVSSETKKQFKVLKELMNRSDVEAVINACDAGREGELIFRLVYDKAGCKKSMKRLWISSLEDEAIKNGFANLKDGSEYDKLYEAALCRERADWDVGINATRFFSTTYGQTLNVGRVMTPTLALTVEREAEIKAFTVEDTFTVLLETANGIVSSEKFKDEAKANEVLKKCLKAKEISITKAEKTKKQEKAPALFDLTTLQREANKKLGFTAQQTLDYAQALYEKKLVSYPRTDSRFLTEDMEATLPELLKKAGKGFALSTTKTTNMALVINSKKVTDHHAIIPTGSVDKVDLKELPSGEQSILKLIVTRLFEAVSSPVIYLEMVVEGTCADEKFTAKGKDVTDLGWKSIAKEKEKKDEEDEPKLKWSDDLKAGGISKVKNGSIKTGKTTPPKSYTEDTLLSAMEKAGASETPDEAERKGLGTPATRAGIIEKLVRIGFLERKGDKKTKYLIPTSKGEALVSVVPNYIKSASMTALWEEKLLEIEKDKYNSAQFMSEIEEMIKNLINSYEVIPDAIVFARPVYDPIGKCPKCGSDVAEKSKGFFCSDKDCKFALWKDNRFFESFGKKMTRAVAEDLIKTGSAKLRKCKSSRTGKEFDTTVVMVVDDDGKPEFTLDFFNKKG